MELRANACRATLHDVLAGHSPEYAGAFASSREARPQQLARLREELAGAVADAAGAQSLEGAGALARSRRSPISLCEK